MLTPLSLTRALPRTLLAPVLRWPAESQQHARRNALVAATALAQATHERREVEAFLLAHARQHAARARHSEVRGAARRAAAH
jgi:hypothetical protein